MTDIKDVCDAALNDPSFKPKKGTTYCNLAVDWIADQMGCTEFDGLMADEIYQTMLTNKSGKWAKVDASDATIWALSNGLAIAGLPSQRLGEAHGHVCVIYAVSMEPSSSLGHDVPMVANVGKSVGVMRSSQAFPVEDPSGKSLEADYFTYAG